MTRTVTEQGNIILEADEGYVLTDGEVYGKKVYLADNADESVWREIPESEIPENENE